MYCNNNIILQQDSLPEIINYYDGDPPDFHIYMICKRPRFLIKPDDVEINDETIRVKLLIQKKDSYEKINFEIPNDKAEGKVRYYSSEYPYSISSFLDSEKRPLFVSKTSLFVTMFSKYPIEESNLEILYIGQAFGENGERTAIDRLSSHSTLQKIYSEAMNNFPDHEIWLMLCSFSPAIITAIDGRSQEFEKSDEDDDEHVHQILSNPLSLQQKINFTEAALIRYFQPPFNEKFKNYFPSKKHKSYSDCYEIDLNSVFVELGSDNLNCMLKSRIVAPTWTHFIHYPLNSEDERKSMLDLTL